MRNRVLRASDEIIVVENVEIGIMDFAVGGFQCGFVLLFRTVKSFVSDGYGGNPGYGVCLPKSKLISTIIISKYQTPKLDTSYWPEIVLGTFI